MRTCGSCSGFGSFFLFVSLLRIGTFYFSSVAPNHDWTVPRNDALWQDDSKTLFDPCPSGWRMPKSGAGSLSPWSAFSLSNGPLESSPAMGGRCFNQSVVTGGTAWYPGAGNRSNSTGLPDYLDGTSGFIWASVSTAYLYFSLYDVFPSYGDNRRAWAFPVRCLRE